MESQSHSSDDGTVIGESVREVRQTFSSGKTREASWRREQLKRLLSLLLEREDDICRALGQDLGKHHVESYRDEVGRTLDKICQLRTPRFEEMDGRQKGLCLEPLIGAIAAGNAVVIKPSELSPVSSSVLADLVHAYLDTTAIKIVQGGVSVGEQLLQQKWDKIFFTAKVGRVVMTAAAKNLTPVALELGGNVLQLSTFSKVLGIRSKIRDVRWPGLHRHRLYPSGKEVLKHFGRTVEDCNIGHVRENPKENIARIINKSHFSRLRNLLDEPMVRNTIVHGGWLDEDNLFVEPTLLLDPPVNSGIMSEEVFGPLLPIITLERIEDSIEFINSMPRPLAIYAFTNSEGLKKKLSSRTSSGSIVFNDAIIQYVADSLPFGGVGESGFGRYHGKFSFEAFSHEKAIARRSFLVDFWKTSKSYKNAAPHSPTTISITPASPQPTESGKKRKSQDKQAGSIEKRRVLRSDKCTSASNKGKKRVYYRKVIYDGGEFSAGDDVYVKRREDGSSDDEDPEVEECRACFKPAGKRIMIECDDCLNGFHLTCLKPPLKEVPEGDWICNYCEARKSGKILEFPEPPKGKKRARTAREKLLSSDLWAVRIESLWKEVDGSYWCRARWYIIPEETAVGRQPHNLRRELYRTNDFADIEMESIIRHCYVMSPKEFSKAVNDGDDVFLCEYEYDIQWHSFKRIAEIDKNEDDGEGADTDDDWNSCDESDFVSEEDIEYDDESKINLLPQTSPTHPVAANSRKGRIFGLQRIGARKIPEHVRCHKQTDLEKAKATLLLATLPKSLPCRDKEMDEITTFIKGAICDEQCLGRCLYIHGVPGTGKTMSVLAVMRNLKSEVDAGSIRPYCFVEINGLKLASPENIYSVIYEGLSGHRVGWKKALHFLNERFSDENKRGKDTRPCILLIDELDLLVTRNQSVLYNILDWPNKPNSKLIVIGIANTMDLPEKLLPRISSRMGIQRLCFGPYNYQQLQEIILSRLKGIDAFEKLAIEFASRKVAAVSGDARRALEICRRAAELADYRAKKSPLSSTDGKIMVGMADVESAIKEMFQAPHIQVIRSSSKLSKIFLAAMVHELYKTGMAETTFEKLAMTVSCFCSSNGEMVPGYDTLLKVGCKLGECRILLCDAGTRHKLQKLQLNYPSDDVTFALKDSKELPWLAKYL
ncbi:UNVERIFIED_CONTAM: Origin of replication complex subunit [Sesamum calycinum]|uniref:Origin recognition complex subunit 1 n=1 Tax=Sesamum calycinum TaxID=2727403 RepID=A0AAW2SBC6_9LAMI